MPSAPVSSDSLKQKNRPEPIYENERVFHEEGQEDDDNDDDADEGENEEEVETEQEQEDDEYDGDLLFSDLVGYFARMKQAVEGVEQQQQYHGNENADYSSSDCISVDTIRNKTPNDLDMTPVKGDNQEYNYDGSLQIDPINLPSLTVDNGDNKDQVDNTPRPNLIVDSRKEASTVKVSTRGRFVRTQDVFKTPIVMPQSNPVPSSGRYSQANMANYNSDTDSSLIQGTCCQMPPFKAKRYLVNYECRENF